MSAETDLLHALADVKARGEVTVEIRGSTNWLLSLSDDCPQMIGGRVGYYGIPVVTDERFGTFELVTQPALFEALEEVAGGVHD